MWYLLYLVDLKAPTASNLARKRVICMNPAKSAKKSKATVHNEPEISPTVRIKEFPNEFLRVSNSKLFCLACREPLSVSSGRQEFLWLK